MSHVDNIILSFSIDEDFAEVNDGGYYVLVARVNDWLREHAVGQEFGPDLDSQALAFGGSKHLETPLFVGAFNGMPEQEFLDFLGSLPWKRPQDVQYIVKRQHSDTFEIVTPRRAA